MNSVNLGLFLRRHWLNLGMIALALAALATAFFMHRASQATLNIAQSRYQQQQGLNASAQQAANLLAEFSAAYRQFQAKGVIGQTQRLQWIEALSAGVDQYLVPKVQFTLSPTVPANETNTLYFSDALNVKVTPMRLDFTLLHEGDFYRLMSQFRQQANGLFSVQSCTLRSSQSDATPDTASYGTSLGGECELLWYSLADITQTNGVAAP